MSFLAVDVQYHEKSSIATVAGVLFASINSATAVIERIAAIENPAEYVSGEFYRRELPCILQLLEQFEQQPHTIIVDSYVDLGAKAGMGRYLYNALNQSVKVIGVAKTRHRLATTAVEVLRGESKNPLYVTSVEIDIQEAATLVANMHGPYRIPTLLKRVDQLARSGKPTP